jgi:hypothetical protein
MAFSQGLDCCYSILELFVQLAELNTENVLKVCVQFPFPKSLEAENALNLAQILV